MNMTTALFLERSEIAPNTLEVWLAEEWIIPVIADAGAAFSEADLARARLIRSLLDDMGVNNEGVSVALHLLDQVHGLRQAMAALLAAVRTSEAAA